MADISNELAKILAEETGEGVRSSIYNGLLKMNNEVINNGALVDGLNDVLVEQTNVDISAFKQYKPGSTIEIGDTNHFYMIPVRFSKGSDADSPWSLSFTVNLPHPFIPPKNKYEVTIRSLAFGLIMDFIDSDGPGTIYPLTIFGSAMAITNGNLSQYLESCEAKLSKHLNSIHVSLTFNLSAPMSTASVFSGNTVIGFASITSFGFRADEVPAT